MSNKARKKRTPKDTATRYNQTKTLPDSIVTNASEKAKIKTPEKLADQYTFTQELGHGGHAKVFLARRLSDNKLAAVKQLRIDSIKNWKEYTLFHREAKVLSTLDIPGVVKLYDACDSLDEDPPCSYIIQEYIDGPTLKEVLSSGYRFSMSQIYELVLQLLDILKKLQAHDPPVIHRDIKPSNIILRNWDRECIDVCLIDFGAVSNAQVQAGGSTIAGTYGYMSPEQNLGRATSASDTYALAALTAYLLSGVEPANMKSADLRLIIDPHVENHPRPLVQTLRQMLEPNMERRLSDITELQRRFRAFRDGQYECITCEGALATTDLEEKLKQVRYLCQPLNIDIWQALPNNPNQRPALSESIFHTSPRFQNYFSESKITSQYDVVGPVLGCSILLLLIAALLYILLSNISSGVFVFAIIGFILLGFMTIPLTHICVRIILRKFNKRNISAILDESVVPSQTCSAHQKLYQYGQKTIATITEISYIPISKLVNINNGMQRIETPPVYRIWYKFNPPDDVYLNDLIHHIDIHNDPTGKFKVGDPLPILYRAAGDDPTVITDSMPFPLPFRDMEYNTDYIYRA